MIMVVPADRPGVAEALAKDCARETAERFRGAGFTVACVAIAITDGQQQIGKGVWTNDELCVALGAVPI